MLIGIPPKYSVSGIIGYLNGKSRRKYIENKLYLKINEEKTKILMVKEAQFLGFGFTTNVSKNRKRKHPEWKYFSTEHPKKREKLKAELRKILDRKALGGIQLVKQKLQKKLRGRVNYFREAIPVKWRAEIDGWVRRRQRQIHWK